MSIESDRKWREANERLSRAAARLKAANAELDAAEREHGQAVKIVELMESLRRPDSTRSGRCLIF